MTWKTLSCFSLLVSKSNSFQEKWSIISTQVHSYTTSYISLELIGAVEGVFFQPTWTWPHYSALHRISQFHLFFSKILSISKQSFSASMIALIIKWSSNEVEETEKAQFYVVLMTIVNFIYGVLTLGKLLFITNWKSVWSPLYTVVGKKGVTILLSCSTGEKCLPDNTLLRNI